jgi:hypothetical protein
MRGFFLVQQYASIFGVMVRLWLLEWQKKRALNRIHAVQREPFAALPDNPNYAAFKKESVQIDGINFQIESFRSNQLLHEAGRLDVSVPFEDPECWWDMQFSGVTLRILSPDGRFVLRSKIDAEKARRFEVKTLWVTKFWLPLLAALVGIIGALTGLFAVLQHKK